MKDKILNKAKDKCKDISFFALKHMLDKVSFNSEKEILDFLSNIKNYNLYLNDILGEIYKRQNSSIDEIFFDIALAVELELNKDKIFDYKLSRIENVIKSFFEIDDRDIKELIYEKQTRHFQELLDIKYLQEIHNNFTDRIEKLNRDFELMESILRR